MSLIEYLQATAPAMATELTKERLAFVREIVKLRASLAKLHEESTPATKTAPPETRKPGNP